MSQCKISDLRLLNSLQKDTLSALLISALHLLMSNIYFKFFAGSLEITVTDVNRHNRAAKWHHFTFLNVTRVPLFQMSFSNSCYKLSRPVVATVVAHQDHRGSDFVLCDKSHDAARLFSYQTTSKA